jgi:hypothetical protein
MFVDAFHGQEGGRILWLDDVEYSSQRVVPQNLQFSATRCQPAPCGGIVVKVAQSMDSAAFANTTRVQHQPHQCDLSSIKKRTGWRCQVIKATYNVNVAMLKCGCIHWKT